MALRSVTPTSQSILSTLKKFLDKMGLGECKRQFMNIIFSTINLL
jgi:hypothetical protein